MARLTLQIASKPFTADVACPPYLNADGLLSDAGRTYIDALLQALQTAMHFATEKLLPVYNDSWIDELHPAHNAASFQANMLLEQIVISEPDSATLYFNDGDMFAGHSIAVGFSGTVPVRADLLG